MVTSSQLSDLTTLYCPRMYPEARKWLFEAAPALQAQDLGSNLLGKSELLLED